MNNGIIGFTETQISMSDSTCKIIETQNFVNIDFDKNEKNLNIIYGCRNDVAVLDKFETNGVYILSFKRHFFANKVFTLILVYKKHSIIAGNFNYDGLKVSENKFQIRFYTMSKQ